MTTRDGKVLCLSRRKWVALTPEEAVRQSFLELLTAQLGYPATLLAAEVTLRVAKRNLRADIVAWSRSLKPLLLVECKAPTVGLSQRTLDQACAYLSALQCQAVAITNGRLTFCALRDNNGQPAWTNAVPTYEQLALRDGL